MTNFFKSVIPYGILWNACIHCIVCGQNENIFLFTVYFT